MPSLGKEPKRQSRMHVDKEKLIMKVSGVLGVRAKYSVSTEEVRERCWGRGSPAGIQSRVGVGLASRGRTLHREQHLLGPRPSA